MKIGMGSLSNSQGTFLPTQSQSWSITPHTHSHPHTHHHHPGIQDRQMSLSLSCHFQEQTLHSSGEGVINSSLIYYITTAIGLLGGELLILPQCETQNLDNNHSG